MTKYLTVLLLALGSLTAHAQTRCPDAAVTDVKAEPPFKQRGTMARQRFTVEVTNVGSDDFKTAPGADIALQFDAPGFSRRPMATQPLRDLVVGESTVLVFEANVDRRKATLPDWDDMPFPTEICGVLTLKSPSGPMTECSVKNNRLCKAP